MGTAFRSWGILLFGLIMAVSAASSAQSEVRNEFGVAVIIGNKTYENGRVPEVSYAHRDAEAFKRYVLDVLGFAEENIIDLRDAGKAEIEAAFGSDKSHQGKVWRYLDPDGGPTSSCSTRVTVSPG